MDQDIINHADVPVAFRPKQPYRCLVADPPWMAKGAKNGWGWSTGPQTFPLMTDEAIKAMGPAIAEHMADDAHYWLWVPNNAMERGFEVLRAWGARPVSILTWVKPRMSLGVIRNASEHLLFGVKGSLPVQFHSQPSWFFAPVQPPLAHKPEEALEIIRRLSPAPRLELFARRPHEKWGDVWGDGVEHSDVVLTGYPVPSDPPLPEAEAAA